MFERSFHFLRHGETDWNLERRMQGWTDIPLNETGRRQARDAIPAIEPLGIGRVVASPLARAHETALIINEKLQKPLSLDTRLKERQYGIFEGRMWREHEAWREKTARDPAADLEETGFPCPEGAETYADFKTRITAAVAEHLAQAGGEKLLFVAHGGVYRVLRRLLTGSVDQCPNALPFLFEKNGGGWNFRALSGEA